MRPAQRSGRKNRNILMPIGSRGNPRPKETGPPVEKDRRADLLYILYTSGSTGKTKGVAWATVPLPTSGVAGKAFDFAAYARTLQLRR